MEKSHINYRYAQRVLYGDLQAGLQAQGIMCAQILNSIGAPIGLEINFPKMFNQPWTIKISVDEDGELVFQSRATIQT